MMEVEWSHEAKKAMIRILGFLNRVCQRFLKAALVRTRAEVTEALRTASMMLKSQRQDYNKS